MEILEVESTRGIKPALIALLQDCVASGASVGFLPPLQEEQGLAYWQGIEGELADGGGLDWGQVEELPQAGPRHRGVGTAADDLDDLGDVDDGDQQAVDQVQLVDALAETIGRAPPDDVDGILSAGNEERRGHALQDGGASRLGCRPSAFWG